MSRRWTQIAVVLVVLASLLCGYAYACRIIHPRRWPHPRPHPIVRPRPQPKAILTRYHSADIKVRDQVAEVSVNATFYNPNNFRMEGTYWFPLPAEAAVKSFQMEINGKPVKGELLDAARAKKIYEDIVRSQKDPALLEWVGSQMLKCRIFPMEAHKETKVALTYTQMLREDAGLVRLNYPLRSAKPNEGNIGQLVVKVEIESKVPLKTVYSATQPFDISRTGEHKALLTYEGKNIDPTRDIDIVFSRDAKDVGLSVISHKTGAENGTFLLTVTPKVTIEKDKVIKKDFIFVCDTSGSMMADEKMEQARKALKFCIGSLNDGDRFNIIAFSGDVRKFSKTLVDFNKGAKDQAEAYVNEMKARGGTAFDEAVGAALEVAKDSKNVPMIVVLTDGNPTIGEQNVKTILANARKANKNNTRVFVFGVGYDVNTKLLDLLAEEHRGVREYVKPKEKIEVKVSAFYTKIANPVLSDIAVDFGDVDVEQVYPKKLPDLFHGGQLTMLGRYKKSGAGNITLKGKVGDEAKSFTYAVKFLDTNDDEYLPRIWALRKVAYLLDEIRLHGEKKEIVEEVTRLGKLHGILTPYTSFLVVEEGAPMPVAVRRELREAAARGRMAYGKKSDGKGAVDDSVNLARHKSGQVTAKSPAGKPGEAAAPAADMLGMGGGWSSRRGGPGGGRYDKDRGEKLKKLFAEAARDTIHQVAGKTFYTKADGFWVDSTYDKKDEAKIVELKLWSDEFLALVKAHPEIGKYVTAHQKLIVVIGKKIYRIK
jgi:Ca-activated chloride channel homolog